MNKTCMVAEVIGVTRRLYAMETLDDSLLSVVDETLKQVFREAGAKVIYDYLESSYPLKLEEIADKPEVFSAGLERLLGSAAPVIEKLPLKISTVSFSRNMRRRKTRFSDYVRELRNSKFDRKRYSVSIMLTDDGSKLAIAEISVRSGRLKAGASELNLRRVNM